MGESRGSSCPQWEMFIDYSPDHYWNLSVKLQKIILVSLFFIIPVTFPLLKIHCYLPVDYLLKRQNI